MKQRTLMGDGTKNCPYYVLRHAYYEATSIVDIIKNICEPNGITRLNVMGSGRYYELREDGWWLTSDTETCDKIHGFPPEGVPMFRKKKNDK